MKPTPSRIELIAERDGGDCHYCGTPLAIIRNGSTRLPAGRLHATADHVIPASVGGSHEAGNFVLACGSCNGDRGDMDYAEYRVLRGLPARPDVLERALTADTVASPRRRHGVNPHEAKAAAAREATRLATEAAIYRKPKPGWIWPWQPGK